MEEVEKKLTVKSYLKLFFLVLLSAIVIAGFLLWQYFQQPVSGEVRVVTTSAIVPISDELERFEGNYFSFAHGSKYSLKSHKEDFEKTGVVLESAFFAQGDINSKKIAITVENIEGRTMADTGNFIMRKKSPKVYTEEKFQINEISGVTFSSTENEFIEKVFFISRNKYAAEIAFTQPLTGDNEPDLEMTEIMKSIQWKK